MTSMTTDYDEREAFMRIVRRACETGLCAVCGKCPRRRYRDGSLSMTCLSDDCLRRWLRHRKYDRSASPDGTL